MKIKRNSLIYKIAEFGDPSVGMYGNTCDFINSLITGIASFSIMSFAVGCMIFSIYHTICYFIDPSIGFRPSTDISSVIMVMGLLFNGIVLLFGSFGLYMEYRWNHRALTKSPSKITLLWRSFRDKICVKIEYE